MRTFLPLLLLLLAADAFGQQPAPAANAAPGPPAQGKVVALQGRVEHEPAAGDERWMPAQLLQPLFTDDRVRTLALSRAAILFIDETQVRLNAGAVLTVQAVKRGTGAPTALDLVRGEGWFRTKNPASGLTIKTPAATAAIRGTEINVRIAPDGESVLTVVEGAAAFSNDAGSVVATAGEEARARPGQAPTKRTLLNPEDAVQWALYYPVAQARRDVAPAALASAAQPGFERLLAGDAAGALAAFGSSPDPWSSIGAARAHLDLGDPAAARAALNRLGETALDGELAVARHAELAALALIEGDAAQARTEIQAALDSDARALRPLLLLATLELTQNHVREAAQAVERARTSSPLSIGALVAAAEVAQARFDLAAAERLLDEALSNDPDEVRALVNRARLRFGTGDTKGASRDAARAATRAPSDATVLSLRGFIQLAEGHQRDAARSFSQAVRFDPQLGEPHLGLGLLAFKQKRPAEGLESMLTATLLEPKVSLYQSYLGKAYYQLRRFPEGLAALGSAKRLDPRDPTPWLYESLFLRDQNRQVDALASLRESIARNGNRAVYRSRLLLDRDEATRNVSLAQLYRQLGFEAWGAFEAAKSLDADLTNASAHLFLGETYGSLPDRTQATGSALLQYLLYSPVNRNSFNNFSEYTALLDQPLRQLSLVPAIGSDSYWSGTVGTRSGNDRFAHNAFVEQISEDGARPDRADDRTTAFAQGKVSLTERDSLFASLVDVTRDDGQGPDVTRIFGLGTSTPVILRQYTSFLDPNLTTRFEDTEGVVGYEHTWRPGTALTAAAQVERILSRDVDPDATISCEGFNLEADPALSMFRSSTRLTYPLDRRTFQAQHTARLGRHQLVGGALFFEQEKERRCDERVYDIESGETFLERSDEVVRQRDHLYRGYVRDEIDLGPRVHATIGVAYDDVRYGALGVAERVDELTRWSPQAALSVEVAENTFVRAAGFRSVSGDFLGAKIAPVTLASFTIERNELPTTVRDEADVSLERGWTRVFAAGRWFVRDAEVPALQNAGFVSPEAETRTQGGSALVNGVLAERWGAFAENYFTHTRTLLYSRSDNVARAGVSFVHPRGVTARVAGSYFRQRFSDDIPDLPRASYFLADADVSYEFAAKRGLLSLRVNNVFDRRFASVLEGLSIQQLTPDRRVYATLRWRL